MSTNIIACLDHSEFGPSVLAAGIWVAKTLHAPLVLKHVLEKPQQAKTDFSGAIGLGAQDLLLAELAQLDQQRSKIQLEQGRLLLDAAKLHAEHQGVVHVSESLRHDDLTDCLLDNEANNRLIILGKRGASHAGAHGLLGVNVERVLRSVHQPVLITQQQFKQPDNFMLAFDGSATMLKNLQTIIHSPLLQGLPCHLVMVAKANATAANTAAAMMAPELLQAAQQLTDAGFSVISKMLHGDADTALEQYAKDQTIDLLVMGAYGHSRIRQLILGSTTAAVLQKARGSVLVLR
jgi:nucleotide-binding universal stress UspA family protein